MSLSQLPVITVKKMEGRQRRMTLPSTPGREDPIWKPAIKPCSDPHNSAAFIFVHGLGDTADGLERKYVHLCRTSAKLKTLCSCRGSVPEQRQALVYDMDHTEREREPRSYDHGMV